MVPAQITKKKPDPAAELEKKKAALAKAQPLKHSQGGLTKSSVPAGTQGLPAKKERNKDEEEGLGGLGAKKSGGSKKEDPCGERKPKIDLDILAEKIYERLLFEARIERERTGWELR